MADDTIYLSVIIPAFNEENRIGSTLESVVDYLSHQDYSFEILIVNDGSTDRTMEVVRTYVHRDIPFRVIDRTVNRGKGYTVREGMLAAQGQIRLFTDADNSTDMSHFDVMKQMIDEGSPIVIASRNSRDVAGASEDVPQPLLKRILGTMGNLFIQLFAVPGIWDTQCGFKAFTAEAVKNIFPRTTINGWGFDIEALAIARRLGYDISLIPAHWIDHKETHVSFISYLMVLLETLRVWMNGICGRYK